MAEAQKDTIYIDVDDEITSIIDKVRLSKHKIVALVLPKRATVLQSIVNMKLLKRTSDQTKKRIVLITSESGLLPLAGAVRLHVAKTLQSKPTIPTAPTVPSADVALDEPDELDDELVDDNPELDKTMSVGKLAGASAAATTKPEPEETIELDDEDVSESAIEDSAVAKADKKSKKKLKVPDFNRFRKRIFLIGGALVLLIVLWYVAFFVMPKASIIIKTDNITSNADVTFTVSTAARTLDESAKIIPAISKSSKKSDTVKTGTTGKKNVGEKATGTAQFYNCNQSDKLSDTNRVVPSGTALSSNGLSFVTTSDATVPPSGFTSGGGCKSDKPSTPVSVVAQDSGDQYNLGARSYSVSGFTTINATGSAMSGGTTQDVSVVSDQDIETAKGQLNDKSKSAAQTDIMKMLQDAGLTALPDTLVGGTPEITSSPKVGEEATDVTVTSVVTYTMLGVKRDDLKTLVINAAKKDIDTSKQQINDDGLDKAIYRFIDKKSANEQKLSVQSTVSTGVSVNEDDLKKQIVGKKSGDVQSLIGALPGVKDVQVKYSPFWVSVIPKKTSRIQLDFQKQ